MSETGGHGMKWINGLTDTEWVRRREFWHRWFAWYPVVVSKTTDGHKIKVWWEYVERKGKRFVGIDGIEWTFIYREMKK
jgi:hypothetical protein